MAERIVHCFLKRKISSFQLRNPTFQEGESSGGPEYMVHVSGDGVEVLKDGDNQVGYTYTVHSIKPNLNDQPIQVQLPEKVSALQNRPGPVKQNLNRNLHKNRNLNRQHQRAIHRHKLGHTMQRTLKPNLGHLRPTSGDYSGLHPMSGDNTLSRNPLRTLTHQPGKATKLQEPGVAKQSENYSMMKPDRNLNEQRNQDYANFE